MTFTLYSISVQLHHVDHLDLPSVLPLHLLMLFILLLLHPLLLLSLILPPLVLSPAELHVATPVLCLALLSAVPHKPGQGER